MTLALVAQAPAARAPVTLGGISDLIGWVIAAPIEEVTWRLSEIGDIRQWVHAQSAATDLRIRAVRLELIALRRVAIGGMVKKIPNGGNQMQAVAKWLASLTDDEFAEALTDLDGDKTPIALYRADKNERDALKESLRDREDATYRENAQSRYSRYRENGRDDRLSAAVGTIIGELISVGEPFSIVEAADILADRLGMEEVEHPVAEGLREVVRSAIRGSGPTCPLDRFSVLPTVLTVECSDGTYMRVPNETAELWHLESHARQLRINADRAEARATLVEEALAQLIWEASGREGYDADDFDAPDDFMGTKIAPLVNRIRRDNKFTEEAS